jgi:hypothetical protein
MEPSMIPNEHAELARAVLRRFDHNIGKPAADVTSLAAFPVLAAIYALADGGTAGWLFCFYKIALHRREQVRVRNEDAPRDLLIFADFMIESHEYGVDVATGEVILVCTCRRSCDESYLVSPSLNAFCTLYASGDHDALM